MNSLKKKRFVKGGVKNLIISVVILVEILAILTVASFAWVETVSSIKITNEANTVGTVDTYVFTEAMIGSKEGTIDLSDYFKKSGDIHFAPASSADGLTMYFPKANISNNFVYRKGNTSDKNTTYLSVTFKLRADTNADFFFTQAPTVSDDVRVSVTAYTEGLGAGDLYDETGKPKYTQIYANSKSTTAVVNATSGATGATKVEAFADHIKGKSSTARLFAVGANETKIVTINVWLQKKPSANTDLTSNMSQTLSIKNLGILSSLTPRHVTLIPTPTWDVSGVNNQTFYAWCWSATNGDADRLYKLELDDNEHYGFDYNGTYQKTLFFRTNNTGLTTANMSNSWSTLGIWNKTEDTTIPNDPIDPTYVIKTISGSSTYDSDTGGNKSTGEWVDPSTIKLAYAPEQTSAWGTLTATTYIGTTTTTHIMEQTNSTNTAAKHYDTVHAWPGKKVSLNASAKSNYRFVGWYLDSDCTGDAVSTDAAYTFDAPSSGTEVTYYAKFVETRTLTIYKYVDGSLSTTAAGTITIGDSTSTASTFAKTFDKDTSVSFSATANAGYTLEGIYTSASGTTKATSPVTLSSNTTYYARFTTNSYNVTAHSRYSTNKGQTYSSTDSNTGGTVKVGSASAGSSSTASVKYKTSVNLVASAASGYSFIGWYDSSGEWLSDNTTYSYTVDDPEDVDVYGRFSQMQTTTIYMMHRGYTSNGMRLYVWGKDTDKHYAGDFPGTTPTYDGSIGLYKYEFTTGEDEDIGIIVSDKGSDSVRSEYTAHIGETIFIGPSGTAINRNYTLGTQRYIYFTKKWTNNYVHHWGGNLTVTSWPGVRMTSTAYTNKYGETVLYYIINNQNTKVIFHNNSGTQTNDTTLGSNSCFYFNSAGAVAGTWDPTNE